MTDADFAPDWVLPPGETVLDAATERGWSQTELARRLGYTEKHLSRLIHGKVPITVNAAQRLARVLGSRIVFWLNLEANYQAHRARLEAEGLRSEWAGWLDLLPIDDMMAKGAIPRRPRSASNLPQIADDCLRFFGVASPQEWQVQYATLPLAFRGPALPPRAEGALSVWLRLGERLVEQAGNQASISYHRARFRDTLHGLRQRSGTELHNSLLEVQQGLKNAGVTLVVVPPIRQAPIQGAVRWLGARRPVIQLTQHEESAWPWQIFYHQADYLLRHGDNPETKRLLALDTTAGTPGTAAPARESESVSQT